MDTMSIVKQIGQNTKVRSKLNVDKNIENSNFDRTYIGRVIDKETYTNRVSGTGNSVLPNLLVSKWLVYAGGKNFKIDVNNSDITSVGQQVRVFVPNNDKLSVYAEVINPATDPDKMIYKKNDKDYDSYKSYGIDATRGIKESDVTINTITQYWLLNDGTYLKKIYILTVINADTEDEEITNIIHPDGKKENLEGFIIGKSSGGSGSITSNTRHPNILEYKDEDPDYTVPATIDIETGETFDTVTETYIYDPEKEEPFDEEKQYQIGDIVAYDDKVYKCTEEHIGEWDNNHFQVLKRLTKVVWGVGVINKDQEDETVNRLVYPDNSEISLIGFEGLSGLG